MNDARRGAVAVLLGEASPNLLALVGALGAGELLTMIADLMIPELVEVERGLAGLSGMLGPITAFGLSTALNGR